MNNFKKYLERLKSPRAESLIEVIVASLVLIITSTAAVTMLTTASDSNNLNRDRMRAMNLAREGIEAVHNIKDTNMLRSGAYGESCWNFLEYTGNTNCDDTTTKTDTTFIKGGKYILDRQLDTYKWYLKSKSSTDNFSSEYKVAQVLTTDPTDFYRVIDIQYMDSNLSATGITYKDGTVMYVKSTVFWKYKSQDHSTTASTYLTRS
ncbi:hypothetical protein KKG71_00375 [Patescibacteria group bacterium]|nr:hypothetical protein [Patescibacteria group bacterium]